MPDGGDDRRPGGAVVGRSKLSGFAFRALVFSSRLQSVFVPLTGYLRSRCWIKSGEWACGVRFVGGARLLLRSPVRIPGKAQVLTVHQTVFRLCKYIHLSLIGLFCALSHPCVLAVNGKLQRMSSAHDKWRFLLPPQMSFCSRGSLGFPFALTGKTLNSDPHQFQTS